MFFSESVDYPDFAHKLSESIERKQNDLGIQFCGTGNGINMSLKTPRNRLFYVGIHILEQQGYIII